MGIDYTKRPKPAAGPAPASAPASSAAPPAAPSPAPAGSPVSLSKVTLTKAAPTVSLTKQGSTGGVLRVNLNWNSRPQGGSLLKKAAGIDLDLGCLYEYTDGSKGAVQALGGSFEDRHTLGGGPICRLDGDDRSGARSGGENLFVDLTRASSIKRIIIYAFIYEGVRNWAAADGVVTLFPAQGPQVEVRLDEADPRAAMCGIAMLDNTSGELQVRREVRYVSGHRELDGAYGWGMRWTAGRK